MKRRNNKPETGSTTSGAAVSKIVDDDHALFRNAMQDVAPLPPSDKIASTPRKQPLPIPRRIVRSQQTVPDDFKRPSHPPPHRAWHLKT